MGCYRNRLSRIQKMFVVYAAGYVGDGPLAY